MTNQIVEPAAYSSRAARILIADDEQRILDEYAYVLGGAQDLKNVALDDLDAELFGEEEAANGNDPSFEVVMCRQGEDAIDAVKAALKGNRPFSIAFLDVRMPPGMDGVSAAERIRALDPAINIVFVTGFSDVAPEALAERIPPVDKMLYCQKPLQGSELKQFARALSAKWMAEQRIQAMQARLQQLMASTSVIIYSTKPAYPFAITFVSANVQDEFGYAPEEVLADERFWMDRVHPDDVESVMENLRHLSEAGEITCDYRVRRADGEYRWLIDQMKLVQGSNGEAAEIHGCCLDVSERRKAEEKVRYLAYFDGLTGLPNRVFMRELLDHALANARRYRHFVAILFLDIDHFKRINDTLGHDAGDALLREVAKRLQSSIRAADQVSRLLEEINIPAGGAQAVSRLGGDEFVIILTEIASVTAAAQAAARIAESLTVPVNLVYDDVTVSASIGISVFPSDGKDAETLLKHADVAMYHAKQNGRNNHQFFTRELNERAARRFSLETKLRKALLRNEFLLHYQPKIAFHDNRVVGMEALLRWQQPEAGLIEPEEFIPVAEELGLIVPIGEWVFHEAARQTASWHAAGLPPLRVSVNLSVAQFKHRRLVQTIGGTLDANRLDPAFFEIELTESMLIEDTDASVAMLRRLKDLGLALSIDDFGTGYSSLGYLKRFPLDALKIDRSFVHDIDTDPNDNAIVKATIALAHSLELRVVAEGAERQIQVDILRAHGCDEAQGYWFSRPLPAEAFASFIGDRTVLPSVA
jgi:PAS domain S-box-containing protein